MTTLPGLVDFVGASCKELLLEILQCFQLWTYMSDFVSLPSDCVPQFSSTKKSHSDVHCNSGATVK